MAFQEPIAGVVLCEFSYLLNPPNNTAHLVFWLQLDDCIQDYLCRDGSSWSCAILFSLLSFPLILRDLSAFLEIKKKCLCFFFFFDGLWFFTDPFLMRFFTVGSIPWVIWFLLKSSQNETKVSFYNNNLLISLGPYASHCITVRLLISIIR